MYNTVLFDLDGTLLDTLQDLAAAGNQTLVTLAMPTHPVEAYRSMVGNGVHKLVERMLPENSRGQATCQLALSLFNRYYEENLNTYTAPYTGIPELLAALNTQGIAMGVVSNKPHDFVLPILNHYFPGIFKAAAGQKQDVPAKPHPAAVLTVMEELHSLPPSTLYCGDSDVDMLTAQAAGVTGCGVLWGFRSREELLGAGAHYLAQNTQDLYQLITQ